MNGIGVRFLAILLLLLTGLAVDAPHATGRDRASSPERPSHQRGGVLATFKVQDERFRVWVTNPETVQALFDLKDGKSTASIPNGRLRPGPGIERHNAPWHWHLDPEDIELADFTTELCDAKPSYVEAHRREFIRKVGRYCPWAAELVDLQDFR
ncbi:MAG: hypothetical protein QOF33_3728 [Thermomicrobiales bacterium]|jgi:hypothetical protein|nr:hypothetical protein [Thermomicrobiales bacterium]MEA2585643.1 hypothetical protein [Thermomicrobiales bacterium]